MGSRRIFNIKLKLGVDKHYDMWYSSIVKR